MNYYINKLKGKGNAPTVNHDQICKYFLSRTKIAQSFLKLVLTSGEQQILELKQTLVKKDSLENLRADAVLLVPMRVKIGDLTKVYFIIEHKSYYDKGAIRQLLDYQCLLRKDLSEEEIRSSAVVLVLFQHGSLEDSAEWRRLLWPINSAATRKARRLLSEKIRNTISSYDIILIDPQDPRVMRCIAEPDCLCRGVVILLDRVNNTYKLPVREAAAIIRDDFASWFKLQSQSQIDKDVGWIASYLKHSGRYELKDLEELEKLLIEYGVLKEMTDVETYYTNAGRQEGLEEGRQEGRQEGSQRRQQQIVVNMLKEKLDISIISKVTGLPEGEIKQVSRLNGANNSR